MEELKYPLTFTQCPNCGSKHCIVEIETNNEIEKGNLTPGMKIPILMTESHLIDKRQPIKEARKFTALVGYYDICADCGTLYCRQIDKVEGTATPKPRIQPKIIPPHGFGNIPFMGRG